MTLELVQDTDTPPILEIGKDRVYPLIFTPENIQRFWENARQFPTIYGHEIANVDEFIEMFFYRAGDGTLTPYGLFWVMNPEKFAGVFYLTNLREEKDEYVDALAHYTFFDRRHHGRNDLVRGMLKFWFEKYGFNRISAEIPNYSTPQARHFCMECGMVYEGKRRKSARYKGEWFDVNLYSILRSEAMK